MEGLPLLKHAMKEKVLMITIDLKVLAFVCQWANSINPFLGSFLFFNSLLSTFSPYFIHKATEQQSLMGGGGEMMGLFSKQQFYWPQSMFCGLSVLRQKKFKAVFFAVIFSSKRLIFLLFESLSTPVTSRLGGITRSNG